MAGRTVCKLDHPVQFGKETIAELAFRELEFGDLVDIPELATLAAMVNPSPAAILRLAGKLSGQPDPVMRKLRGGDIGKVSEVVLNFTLAALSDGDGASDS